MNKVDELILGLIGGKVTKVNDLSKWDVVEVIMGANEVRRVTLRLGDNDMELSRREFMRDFFFQLL